MQSNKNLADMNKPVFGYLQAMYLSFYSSPLYIDVNKRWKGFGFLYLCLVVAILTLPLGIKWSMHYNQIFKEKIVEPIHLLPILVIKNGELVFDKPMPYSIKNAKGQVVAIIDTTGQITSVDKVNNDALFVLITKNNIQFRTPDFEKNLFGSILSSQNKGKVQDNVFEKKTTFAFDKKENDIFDPKIWAKEVRLDAIKTMTTILVYPVIYFMFLGLILTFIPVMALLGQFFATILFAFKLSFKDACRLMAVASTPTQWLFFIVITFFVTLTGIGIPLVALLTAYFSFAVIMVKRASKHMVFK